MLVILEVFLCGGGSYFVLYLDFELLNGFSGVCEIYGNLCFVYVEEFVFKYVEFWGFEYIYCFLVLLELIYFFMLW